MPTTVKKTLPFWVCLVSTITLLIAGFLVPPMGVIDGSTLTAAGILAFFATISQIPVIIQVAGYVRMTSGNLTLEASKSDDAFKPIKHQHQNIDE